jgi:hypothetical protein
VNAAFVKAVVARDRAALEKLHADLTWSTAEGGVQTRAEILQHLPKTTTASDKVA